MILSSPYFPDYSAIDASPKCMPTMCSCIITSGGIGIGIGVGGAA